MVLLLAEPRLMDPYHRYRPLIRPAERESAVQATVKEDRFWVVQSEILQFLRQDETSSHLVDCHRSIGSDPTC